MTAAAGGGNGGARGEARVVELERENATLRQRLVGVEAERDALERRLANVEVENRRWVEQYVSSEQQRSDLTHLYAAAHALSARASRGEVVEAIREIVTNLVGAEEMAIFETSADGAALSLVAAFGGVTPPRNVRFGEGVIGQATLGGGCFIAPRTEASGVPGEASVTACIPLKARERVVGAIVLFRLLPQKDGLGALDEKLFELLSQHAGTALVETAHRSTPTEPKGAV